MSDDESKVDQLVTYLVHERTTSSTRMYREVVDPLDGLVIFDRQYVKRAALKRLRQEDGATGLPDVLEVTVRAVSRAELREAMGGG